MSVKFNIDNHRCYFSKIGDAAKVKGSDAPKGIKTHRLFGKMLSWFGLAFYDRNAGWLNKKSLVKYLKRNEKLSDGEAGPLIRALKQSSTLKKVQEAFNKAKKCPALVQHIAVIGGPGTGKTTTINALRERGEITKKEVATKLIKKALEAGQKNPVYEESFDLKVARGKSEQLERFEKKEKARNTNKVFHDRGPADPIVYATVHKYEISEPLKEQVEKNCEQFSKLAFFLEKLAHYENTEIRPESEHEAKTLGDKTKEIYSERGYKVISVPSDTVENRVAFILTHTELFMSGEGITS